MLPSFLIFLSFPEFQSADVLTLLKNNRQSDVSLLVLIDTISKMSSFNKELSSKTIQDFQGSMCYRKIKIFESLLKAVRSNNIQEVKEILASGIEVNDMSKNSQSVLHLAHRSPLKQSSNIL